MIHFRSPQDAHRTACLDLITDAADAWGHPLTEAGEPITQSVGCVNCTVCRALLPPGDYAYNDGVIVTRETVPACWNTPTRLP
jgi:hypothetical protein